MCYVKAHEQLVCVVAYAQRTAHSAQRFVLVVALCVCKSILVQVYSHAVLLNTQNRHD